MKKLIPLIIVVFFNFFYSSNINPTEYSQEIVKKTILKNQKKRNFIRRRRKRKNFKKKKIQKSFQKLKKIIENTKNEPLIQTLNNLVENIKKHEDPTINIEILNKIAEKEGDEILKNEIKENKDFFDLAQENIKNNIISSVEKSLQKENQSNKQEEKKDQKKLSPKENNSLNIKQLEELKSLGEKIKILINQKSLINILPVESLYEIIKKNQKIPKNIIAKTHPDSIIKNQEKNQPTKQELRQIFISLNEYNKMIDEIKKTENNEIVAIEDSSTENQLAFQSTESLPELYFEDKNKEDTHLTLAFQIKSSEQHPQKNKQKDISVIPIKHNNKNTSVLKEKKATINQTEKEELQKKQIELEEFIADQKRFENELIGYLPQKIQFFNKKYKNNEPRNNPFIENTTEKNKKTEPHKTQQKKEIKTKTISNKKVSNIDLETIRIENIKLEREAKQKLNIEKSKKEKSERTARRTKRLEEEAKELEAQYNKIEAEWQNNNLIKIINNEKSNTNISTEKNQSYQNQNIENKIEKAEIEFYKNKELTNLILSEILDIKNQINSEEKINTKTDLNIIENKNNDLMEKLNLIEKSIEEEKKKLAQTRDKLNSKFKTKKTIKTIPVNFIELQKSISNIPPSNSEKKLQEIQNQHVQALKAKEIEFNERKKKIEIAFNEGEEINKKINKKKEQEKKEKQQAKNKKKRNLKAAQEYQVKKQQELDKKTLEEKNQILKTSKNDLDNKELITEKTITESSKPNINISNNISNHPLHKISKNFQTYNNSIVTQKNTKKTPLHETNLKQKDQNFNENLIVSTQPQNPPVTSLKKYLPQNSYQQATQGLLNLVNSKHSELTENNLKTTKETHEANDAAMQYYFQNQYNNSLIPDKQIYTEENNTYTKHMLNNNLHALSLKGSVNYQQQILKRLQKSVKILGKK